MDYMANHPEESPHRMYYFTVYFTATSSIGKRVVPHIESQLLSVLLDCTTYATLVDGIVCFSLARGGTWNFLTGGLTLPMRGLKYGFQGIVNAKISDKIVFHLPTGG